VELVEDADGTWLAVAADAPAAAVELAVSVTTPAGAVLEAIKQVAVGAARADDPVVVAIEADGVAIGDGGLALRPDQTVALSTVVDGEAAATSWYASAGAIERYRHDPTELVAAAEPGRAGVLIAVVRDRAGGVGWLVRPLAVE
jgi:hypothetical protein